ncbi:MAG: 1,4-alpha-glucan branching protein GlgB [Caldilineaceae bacterium]
MSATLTQKSTESLPLDSGTLEGAEIDAIVGGYHGAPHAVLGMHVWQAGPAQSQIVVRAFRPLDTEVYVYDVAADARYPMRKLHKSGFYELLLAERSAPFAYRLILVDHQNVEHEIEDAYRFPFLLTDFDLHLYGEGNFTQAYAKMGAQFRTVTLEVADGTEQVRGVNFAVWAPNAQRVSVVGPFNAWDNRIHAMTRRSDGGLWEIFIPNLVEWTEYKFSIKSQHLGYEIDKTDPYGFFAEVRPKTASRVWDMQKYAWGDADWVSSRAEHQRLDQPMCVYELHLGSWRRVPEDNGFLTYRDLAHQVVDYVVAMGYTHVELLPITEHPFDGSWGYQTVGYFAPTSRFGTPDDFKYFVDHCHQHGIGVILDWVPAHFPKDGHGLAFFDGTHLYEHADARQGEHTEWGTKIFNFGRNEVRNFLKSSALFWLKEYHLDGLRVDAVASMLYLDYAREGGEWIPNRYGGRENLEAIDFLRRFNEVVHAEAPGALTIAEESTSWPMVTRPTYAGGLGFDLKWNMGWMHDMLSYFQKDPFYRRYHHNQITFSLMYAFSENFLLPFSHDEVVHLKRSMLDKMPGDLWQKFANLRALYTYMYGHPGKKLLFMGGEFGQWREWNEAQSLDWHLLNSKEHTQLQQFVKDLNHLYQHEPALHQVDFDWNGFQWIDINDVDNSVVSFARRAADPNELLVFICNFTPKPHLGYRVGVPLGGEYSEILNSDWVQYGGSGVQNSAGVAHAHDGGIVAENLAWQSCAFSASINLPPLGVTILKAKRH